MISLNGVNFNFLRRMEGRQLKGYVPMKGGVVIGKSGVTVATGVDLGQRRREQIQTWNIPNSLKLKVLPYAEKRREEAVKILNERPLTVTSEEADMLDFAVIHEDIRTMAQKFEEASGYKFDSMPWQVQTVLASLALNFGPGLHRVIPNTWKIAIARDWIALERKLENFPSSNPELVGRRKKEAALVRQIVG